MDSSSSVRKKSGASKKTRVKGGQQATPAEVPSHTTSDPVPCVTESQTVFAEIIDPTDLSGQASAGRGGGEVAAAVHSLSAGIASVAAQEERTDRDRISARERLFAKVVDRAETHEERMEAVNAYDSGAKEQDSRQAENRGKRSETISNLGKTVGAFAAIAAVAVAGVAYARSKQ